MKIKYNISAAFFSAFCFATALTGCSNKTNKEIQNSFTSNLDSIISGDYGESFHYISINGQVKDSISNGDVSSAIMSKITFSYKKADIENEAAIIEADFTYPDIVSLTNTIVNENGNISDEDYTRELLKRLESGDYSIVSCSAEIPCIQLEDKWYIIENEQLSNIFSGGVYAEYAKAEEEAFNKFKEMEELINEQDNK